MNRSSNVKKSHFNQTVCSDLRDLGTRSKDDGLHGQYERSLVDGVLLVHILILAYGTAVHEGLHLDLHDGLVFLEKIKNSSNKDNKVSDIYTDSDIDLYSTTLP